MCIADDECNMKGEKELFKWEIHSGSHYNWFIMELMSATLFLCNLFKEEMWQCGQMSVTLQKYLISQILMQYLVLARIQTGSFFLRFFSCNTSSKYACFLALHLFHIFAPPPPP